MPEAREEIPRSDTIIWTVAGNTTLVRGMKPTDIEPILVGALANKTPFVYLDSDGTPANSLCVSPAHVVALIEYEHLAF